MSYTKAKGKTQERSDAKNCRRFALKLTKSTDADIIALLENKENKQGYIKALIRHDLERKKGLNRFAFLERGGGSVSKADEYKKIALEILRELLESEETVIFEYSGSFKESAADLKETAMGYLERLGEGEDTFNKLVKNLLIADYYKEEGETDG